MTHSSRLVPFLVLCASACVPEPQHPRNWIPDAFAREITSCESRYRMNADKADNDESSFQGWLKGATPGMKQSSEFKSMMGVHDSTQARIDKIKQDYADLMGWAQKTKPIATQDDYTHLQNTCTTLGVNMANAGTFYFSVGIQQTVLTSRYPK